MTKMKTAIIILSDPKGGEEALGRVFNALAFAHESLHAGDQVEVVFNGAGTRWPEELSKVSHPANALYNTVREAVKGASCGCAAVFGATKSVESCGLPLLKHKALREHRASPTFGPTSPMVGGRSSFEERTATWRLRSFHVALENPHYGRQIS